MRTSTPIPTFGLYGELDHFPDLVHCEDLSARAPIHDWHIPAHRHDRMSQLFLIDEGWMRAKVDGESHHLSDGDLIYIPENCVHQLAFRAETYGRVYSFPLSVVASLGPNPSDVLSVLTRPIVGKSTARLLQGAEMLNDITQIDSTFRAQQVVSMAHFMLSNVAELHLTSAAENHNPHPDRLRALDALIRQNMAAGWGPAEYATALSLTTGHLSRLCREATGRGVSSYLEQKTMNEASRLLAFTRLPMAEIGYRLGFADPSYFSKRFRAARGQTPSQYRARFTA